MKTEITAIEAAKSCVEMFAKMNATREEVDAATKIVARWADEFVKTQTSMRISAFAAMLLLSYLNTEQENLI
jgi:hypothetical protein